MTGTTSCPSLASQTLSVLWNGKGLACETRAGYYSTAPMVLSLQTLPSCIDTESNWCCGTERVLLARLPLPHSCSQNSKADLSSQVFSTDHFNCYSMHSKLEGNEGLELRADSPQGLRGAWADFVSQPHFSPGTPSQQLASASYQSKVAVEGWICGSYVPVVLLKH